MIKYASDIDDHKHVATIYLTLSRCIGNRIIHPGYICPHCNSSNPSTECLSPNPKSSKVPIIDKDLH